MQVSVSLAFLALSICCLSGSAEGKYAKRYVLFLYEGTGYIGGTVYYLVAFDQKLKGKEALEKCARMGGELATVRYGEELDALSESLKKRNMLKIDDTKAKFWVRKKFAEPGLNMDSYEHEHGDGKYCRSFVYNTKEKDFLMYGRGCSYKRHYICNFWDNKPDENYLAGFLDGSYETCSTGDAPKAAGQKSGGKSLSSATTSTTIIFAAVISILVICQM